MYVYTPSWELTYPLPKYFWVDDVPFPKVGYVSSLEGVYIYIYMHTVVYIM